MADEQETFLQRWARRKAERLERAPRDDSSEKATDTRAPTTTPAVVPPEQLPSTDDLTKDSDFTAFLKEGVPEEVKRLALRKLWRSDPVFANLDGLVEYGEDFGAPFRNAGAAVATLFRLGRGMPAPGEAMEHETPTPEEPETHEQSEVQGPQHPASEDPEAPPGEHAEQGKNVSASDPNRTG